MTGGLLDDDALHASAVVANSAMNRQRQLAGVNSYTRDWASTPLDWLTERLRQHSGEVGWLRRQCHATGRPARPAVGGRRGR
jgi:hypothetical protein